MSPVTISISGKKCEPASAPPAFYLTTLSLLGFVSALNYAVSSAQHLFNPNYSWDHYASGFVIPDVVYGVVYPFNNEYTEPIWWISVFLSFFLGFGTSIGLLTVRFFPNLLKSIPLVKSLVGVSTLIGMLNWLACFVIGLLGQRDGVNHPHDMSVPDLAMTITSWVEGSNATMPMTAEGHADVATAEVFQFIIYAVVGLLGIFHFGLVTVQSFPRLNFLGWKVTSYAIFLPDTIACGGAVMPSMPTKVVQRPKCATQMVPSAYMGTTGGK
jgi:hypothetical protein